MIKIANLFFLASFVTGPVLADEQHITSKQLAQYCAHLKEKPAGFATAACGLRIDGFVRGYRAGSFRGLSTVFIYDEKASATTQGFADMKARIEAQRQRASCVPDDITIEKIAFHFLLYLAKNPDEEDKPYDQTLRFMFEDLYCRS